MTNPSDRIEPPFDSLEQEVIRLAIAVGKLAQRVADLRADVTRTAGTPEPIPTAEATDADDATTGDSG